MSSGRPLRTHSVRTLLVLLLLWPAHLVAPPTEEEVAAEKLFAQMREKAQICDCFQLGEEGPFAIGSPGMDKVRRRDLRRILRKYENSRGNGFVIENQRFRQLITSLEAAMKKEKIASFSRARFLELANASHAALRSAGELGECHVIETSFNMAKTITGLRRLGIVVRQEAVPISPATQKLIEAAFHSEKLQKEPLTEREIALVEQGVLNLDQLHELRAIRKAGELLQRSTYLLFTFPGDFLVTNNLSGILGNRKQVCSHQASTNRMFLKRLASAGLLRHFAPLEKSADRGTHVAAALGKAGSDAPFAVLDSWATWGGEAPNLTLYEDWKRRRDNENVVPVLSLRGEEALPKLPSRFVRTAAAFVPVPLLETFFYRDFKPSRLARCREAVARFF